MLAQDMYKKPGAKKVAAFFGFDRKVEFFCQSFLPFHRNEVMDERRTRTQKMFPNNFLKTFFILKACLWDFFIGIL
jgi:hypothetical protein